MALYVKFDCATCENEYCTGHGLPTTEKVCDGYMHTTTNADRIRSLSDEELAEQLYLLRLDALRLEGFEGFIETKDEVLEWLKEEAEGGEI